jgi:uncharacterized UPF0146 family protein
MGEYKHIETCVGRYLADHYSRAIEVGIGRNTDAAAILNSDKKLLRCTDIKSLLVPGQLPFITDDIFSPVISLYREADVIYAIRPGIEMIPPLITLAREVDCDLIVCHLGFELYGNGGETIDCGVTLHRYFCSSKPVKKG